MKAVVVYAYGEDPYMEPQYADLVGVFTSTRKMIAAMRADELTRRQHDDQLKGREYDWQLGREVQIDYNPKRGDKSSFRLVPIELNKKLS